MPTETKRLTAPVVIDPLTHTPAPAGELSVPWTGTTIMVRHRPDGLVTASCRGLLAVGPTETAALQGLAKLVKAAGHLPEPAPTLRTAPRA